MSDRDQMRARALTFVVAIGACTTPRTPAPVAVTPPAWSLDEALAAAWRHEGVRVAPAASDGEFLRRVTVDLVGRVPTLAEARAFLADGASDKRARVVDDLLASHAFAARWASLYAGLLWGRDLRPRLEKRLDPEAWLERALFENWPYDRIVSDVVAGTGAVSEAGGLAFLVAKQRAGGAEAVAAATARVFLGLQLQCAQCHDHPYDPRWKQDDFYGLVAFFARTKVRRSGAMSAGPAEDFTVEDVERGEAKLRRPKSDRDEIVAPRFLGRPVAVGPGQSRRRVLARELVTTDLFAKAAVNHTWALLFGHGIVDPWDDLGAEDDPHHPELLTRLAREFVASGHDLRALLRRIVLSAAYARSSRPADGVPPDDRAAVRAFAQAGVRPLGPEALFDSLAAETGLRAIAARRQADDEQVERRMRQALRALVFVFGDDEMTEVDAFDGTLPQALALWNGELTNRGARAAAGGVLDSVLAASTDVDRRLDDLFLAVYTRTPTPAERASLVPALHGGGRRAWEDLFFALLVSTEAITNH